MKEDKKFYCFKHNEVHQELWEGQFLCISCYEDYILQENAAFTPHMSDEYYQSIKDSE